MATALALALSARSEEDIMARPKKTINFDYGVIDNAPQGQVHKIGTYAADVGVSGPTMRQRIAEHYGDRVTFIRGRKGGFTVTAVPQEDAHDTTNAAV